MSKFAVLVGMPIAPLALHALQDDAMLSALHGPGSPCAWLLARLLDWGGSSGRIMLLLASQVGAFVEAQPRLVHLHAPQLLRLLLWGTPQDGERPTGGLPRGGEELRLPPSARRTTQAAARAVVERCLRCLQPCAGSWLRRRHAAMPPCRACMHAWMGAPSSPAWQGSWEPMMLPAPIAARTC